MEKQSSRRSLGLVIVIGGAVLVIAGAIVIAQWWTTTSSQDSKYASAQQEAEEAFQSGDGSAPIDPQVPGEPPTEGGDGTSPLIDATFPDGDGSVIARLDFLRPGADERPVSDQPIYVRDGVSDALLAQGPGRYPSTAPVGARGNTAIAGHRTGFGSPFLHLDDLEAGDEVVLSTSDDEQWTYRVVETRIVEPDETWVLQPDPLGMQTSMLTLTTCDPPHTDDLRLIVFAELVNS